jgi:hypothetical protein
MTVLGMLTQLSCRTATQVSLQLSTDVAGGSDTSVLVQTTDGSPGGAPVAVSTIAGDWGPDGRLGSLTLVPPASASNARAGVRVLLGKGKSPEACAAQFDAHCIQGTRRFAYQSGHAVTVPVGLYAACLGVLCPGDQTCNYAGKCVSNEIDTSRCDDQAGCILEGDPPSPPGVRGNVPVPIVDAEAPDAASVPSPTIRFVDRDPRPGFVEGKLDLTLEGQADGVRVHWTAENGTPLGELVSLPASGPLKYAVLPGTRPPAGAMYLEAEALRGSLRSSPARVLGDNFLRAVDIGTDRGSDALTDTVVLADEIDKKLLVVGLDLGGRATLRRCEFDGSQCEGRVLDPAGTARTVGGLAATLVPSTRQLVVLVGANEGFGEKRGAKFLDCTANGDKCVVKDAGPGLMGGAPAIVAVTTPAGPRVVAATQAQGLHLVSCPAAALGPACPKYVHGTKGTTGAITSLAFDAAGTGAVHAIGGTNLAKVTCSPDLAVCQADKLGDRACESLSACESSTPLHAAASFDFVAAEMLLAVGTSAGLQTLRCPLSSQSNCGPARLIDGNGTTTPRNVTHVPGTSGFVVRHAVGKLPERQTACRGDFFLCTDVVVPDLRGTAALLRPLAGNKFEFIVSGSANANGDRPTVLSFKDVSQSNAFTVADISILPGAGLLGNVVAAGTRVAATISEGSGGVRLTTQDPSALYRPSLFACGPRGSGCTHRGAWVGTGATEGPLSGSAPSIMRSEDDRSTIVVTRDAQGPIPRLSRWRCSDDQPSCEHRTIIEANWVAGSTPRAVRQGSRLVVVARRSERLTLLNCNEAAEDCREPLDFFVATGGSVAALTATRAGTVAVSTVTPSAGAAVFECSLAPTSTCTQVATVPAIFLPLAGTEGPSGHYFLLGATVIGLGSGGTNAKVLDCSGSPWTCTEAFALALPSQVVITVSAALAWDNDHQALYIAAMPANIGDPGSFLRCSGVTKSCDVLREAYGPAGAEPSVLLDSSRNLVTFAYRDAYQLGRPFIGWLERY